MAKIFHKLWFFLPCIQLWLLVCRFLFHWHKDLLPAVNLNHYYQRQKKISCSPGSLFLWIRCSNGRNTDSLQNTIDIFFSCPISHSLPAESSPYPEVLSSQLIKPGAAQQQTLDIVFPIPSLTVEFRLIQYTKYLNMQLKK